MRSSPCGGASWWRRTRWCWCRCWRCAWRVGSGCASGHAVGGAATCASTCGLAAPSDHRIFNPVPVDSPLQAVGHEGLAFVALLVTGLLAALGHLFLLRRHFRRRQALRHEFLALVALLVAGVFVALGHPLLLGRLL